MREILTLLGSLLTRRSRHMACVLVCLGGPALQSCLGPQHGVPLPPPENPPAPKNFDEWYDVYHVVIDETSLSRTRRRVGIVKKETRGERAKRLRVLSDAENSIHDPGGGDEKQV